MGCEMSKLFFNRPLAEQAGFDAVWASGFGISSSLKCIPDASFITLTEQLDIERNMAEAITIPIVADCDTGYGNTLNVMRVVSDHERAGIAAICIEPESPKAFLPSGCSPRPNYPLFFRALRIF